MKIQFVLAIPSLIGLILLSIYWSQTLHTSVKIWMVIQIILLHIYSIILYISNNILIDFISLISNYVCVFALPILLISDKGPHNNDGLIIYSMILLFWSLFISGLLFFRKERTNNDELHRFLLEGQQVIT